MPRMRRRIRAAAVPLVAVVVAGSVVTLGVVVRNEPDKPGGATGEVTPVASPSAPDPGVVDVTSPEQKKAAGQVGAGAGVQVAPDGRSVSVNLGELAPADSTLALALPRTTKNSWDLVSRLMPPQTGLATLNLADSPASAAVGVLGYAQAPASGDRYAWPGGGSGSSTIDVLYLATASEKDAETLSGWLQQQNLRISVAVSATLVVVTPGWASPVNALTGDHLSTNVRYRDSLSRLPRSSTNTLWLDVPSYLKNLTTGRDEIYTAAMKDYLSAVLGGSTGDDAKAADSLYFVATSAENAYSWSGTSSVPLRDVLNADAAKKSTDGVLQKYAPATTDNTDNGIINGDPVPEGVMDALEAQAALAASGGDVARLNLDLSTLVPTSDPNEYAPNIASISVVAGGSEKLNVEFSPTTELSAPDIHPLPLIENE